MFHIFYDKTTGVISRCYEGTLPEKNAGPNEEFFSSSEFIHPDNFKIDIHTKRIIRSPAVVIDPLPAIRSDRNRLLAATDWTQLSDASLSASQILEARAYRQALRDMMALNPPVFPDAPAWLF